MAINARERLVEIIQKQIAVNQQSLDLMESGLMTTSGEMGYKMVDTTQQSMSYLLVRIAELEEAIRILESENT